MVIDEIATLPTVARNDKRGLRHSLDSSAKGFLMSKNLYIYLKGFFFLLIFPIFHFAYEIFPSPVLVTICAINESIWQHFMGGGRRVR